MAISLSCLSLSSLCVTHWCLPHILARGVVGAEPIPKLEGNGQDLLWSAAYNYQFNYLFIYGICLFYYFCFFSRDTSSIHTIKAQFEAEITDWRVKVMSSKWLNSNFTFIWVHRWNKTVFLEEANSFCFYDICLASYRECGGLSIAH